MNCSPPEIHRSRPARYLAGWRDGDALTLVYDGETTVFEDAEKARYQARLRAPSEASVLVLQIFEEVPPPPTREQLIDEALDILGNRVAQAERTLAARSPADAAIRAAYGGLNTAIQQTLVQLRGVEKIVTAQSAKLAELEKRIEGIAEDYASGLCRFPVDVRRDAEKIPHPGLHDAATGALDGP